MELAEFLRVVRCDPREDCEVFLGIGELGAKLGAQDITGDRVGAFR